jgi:hypothetical protein
MVWLPQCRASCARGPPLTSLGVLALGLDMADKAAMAAGAAAARALEGVTECAPHPDHAPSHACVCARDTGACNMPWVQQRRCLRRTLRECSRERPDGDGAGGGNCVVGRGLEGEDGGVKSCEGVDGVEEGASTAAREAEGSDVDEVMAGKENISMQRAEGGGGVTAGIKKKKPKRRAKGTKSQQQRQDGKRPGGAREA